MSDIVKITKDELSKVENPVLNEAQFNFLFKKTPQKFIYSRPAKGGGTWKYVTGTYVKKVLNLMFGWDWDFEIVEHEVSIPFKQVVVKGRLTCRTETAEIVKMQFGRQDIKFRKNDTDQPLDIGNDLKGAATDALKKCASELGIAADVYAPNEFREIEIVESEEQIEKGFKWTYIESLMATSTITESQQEEIWVKLYQMSFEELSKTVDNLKENQKKTLDQDFKERVNREE